mgnify:FL=1
MVSSCWDDEQGKEVNKKSFRKLSETTLLGKHSRNKENSTICIVFFYFFYYETAFFNSQKSDTTRTTLPFVVNLASIYRTGNVGYMYN